MNQIMTFNTTKCQEVFRNRFTGASGIPFRDFKYGKTINQTVVDPSDVLLYDNARKEDILNFYYKALLSFAEGLDAFSRKNYTWATIKLYYSVYFGLRTSLLCRSIILVRANKHLYKLKIASGEVYNKPKEMRGLRCGAGRRRRLLHPLRRSTTGCRRKVSPAYPAGYDTGSQSISGHHRG